MKLPRDISGQQLSRLIGRYGYSVTRQTGSHIRLSTQVNGEHHITIPAYQELRIGTLNAILTDIAEHLGRDRKHVIRELFGE